MGTVFNVNAYADEMAAVTTLVSGSVKITAAQKTVISNRDNSQFSKIKHATKTVADPYRFMAWKDNRFVFGEQMDIKPLRALLRVA